MHRAALPMAAAILRQVPTARFRFAGDGTLDAYRREAEALGIADRVDFTGFIEQADAFLQAADIFFYPLNPFTYATSEKALQEAMAAGLPCIVFPHGGIRDLVTPDCAAVVDDCAAFVAAAVALARDPGRRAAMGRAAGRRLATAEHILHWRDHLARTWVRLVDRPRRPRAALAIPRGQLFARCTDTAAHDLGSLDAEAQADFRQVAAFVTDAYGLDVPSLPGGALPAEDHR
ncbi:glycosyltransferase family 4 protein [Niveispirillum fermenti]